MFFLAVLLSLSSVLLQDAQAILLDQRLRIRMSAEDKACATLATLFASELVDKTEKRLKDIYGDSLDQLIKTSDVLSDELHLQCGLHPFAKSGGCTHLRTATKHAFQGTDVFLHNSRAVFLEKTSRTIASSLRKSGLARFRQMKNYNWNALIPGDSAASDNSHNLPYPEGKEIRGLFGSLGKATILSSGSSDKLRAQAAAGGNSNSSQSNVGSSSEWMQSCKGDAKIVQTVTLTGQFDTAKENKYRNHVKESLDLRNLGNLNKDEIVVLDDSKAKATMTLEIPPELRKETAYALARQFDKDVEGLTSPVTSLMCNGQSVEFKQHPDNGSEIRFKINYAANNLPTTDSQKAAAKTAENTELRAFFEAKGLTNCTMESKGLSRIENVADKSYFTMTLKNCDQSERSGDVANEFYQKVKLLLDSTPQEKAQYPTLKLLLVTAPNTPVIVALA